MVRCVERTRFSLQADSEERVREAGWRLSSALTCSAPLLAPVNSSSLLLYALCSDTPSSLADINSTSRSCRQS